MRTQSKVAIGASAAAVGIALFVLGSRANHLARDWMGSLSRIAGGPTFDVNAAGGTIEAGGVARARGAGEITPSIVKAREANGSTDVCAAPCGVHFDATGTTWAGHSQDEADLDLDYVWTFDDPNCSEDGDGIFDASRKTCNEQVGPIGAHLFESPGTYSVKLEVIDPVGLTGNEETVTVVVSDPGVVWAGAKTHCISADGTSATCPNGGTTHLNVRNFITALSTYLPANGDTQILFERGDTFSSSGGTFRFLPEHKKLLIGAYGSGAKPKVTLSSGGSLLGAGCDQAVADDFAPQDARLMDINVEGSSAHTLYGGGDSDSSKQLTIYNVDLTGTWGPHPGSGGEIDLWSQVLAYCCSNGPAHPGGCSYNDQSFFVEVGFSYSTSNRNLTYSARRSAFLGNTFGGVQDDGSEHVIRMQGLERNVISRNHWIGPTGVHQMKLHATGTDDGIYVGTEQFTMIEGNLYEGVNTGSPWSLGQENGVAADGCGCCEYNKKMHVLGNYFRDGTGSVNSGVEIHGDYAKAKDNICEVTQTGDQQEYRCVAFDTRCTTGATFRIRGHHRAVNNRAYDGAAHSQGSNAVYFEQGSNNRARDNILFAPHASGAVSALSDSGGTCGLGLCTRNFTEAVASPFGTSLGLCITAPNAFDEYEICRALSP